jgi:hypothetical protein
MAVPVDLVPSVMLSALDTCSRSKKHLDERNFRITFFVLLKATSIPVALLVSISKIPHDMEMIISLVQDTIFTEPDCVEV